MDLVDAVGQAAAGVLLLPSIATSVSLSGLSMPTNTMKKPASRISASSDLVVEQVDRRLGREDERIVVFLLPKAMRGGGGKSLHRLLVADEIVVDEIDMATIAAAMDRLELGQHLRHGLHAWPAAG